MKIIHDYNLLFDEKGLGNHISNQIKDNEHISTLSNITLQKPTIKRLICKAINCSLEATERIDVNAAKYGTISLNVFSRCISISKPEIFVVNKESDIAL